MPASLTFDGLLAARLGDVNGGARPPVLVSEDAEEVGIVAFDDLVGRTAGWLRAQGLTKGDRVAIWLPNRMDWMALLFGAARIGTIVTAVNTRYRTAELHHILRSSGARMLIFERCDDRTDFLAMIADLDASDLPELQTLAVIGNDDPEPAGPRPVIRCAYSDAEPLGPQGATPEDPVLLLTTSGTTSAPKLVLHRQQSLVLHAHNCAGAYGLNRAGASYLAVLPFCGVFGLNPTLAAIAGGAPVHLNTTFDVARAVATARAASITHFFGSDDMFRMMWTTDRGAFAGARLCGFATFTPGLAGVMQEMATAGLPLCGVYGASEVNAIFSIQPLDLPLSERLQGGGRPAGGDGATLRVRHAETEDLCHVGELGLLEIRSPTNFAGYFRNSEATARAVDSEGFFRSGDVGHLRADGTFVYLARGGDFIRLSGFLTDPREIEEVIEAIDGVIRAQVVGVVHAGRTRPAAFVTTRAGGALGERDIIETTRERLAHYKIPVLVAVLEDFPTTESANGLKIRKARLREMAAEILAEREVG